VELSSLRWFQQVADGTTVTEVSEIEGVTQSGVSRSLARLESELGIALLRRSGRTLRMTRAGATFKHYVDRMLHEFDDGQAALSELASPDSGTVSIAFQLSLGTWLIPGLIAGFHRQHPGVRFDLHQVREEQSAEPLLEGTVDLQITTVRPLDARQPWRPLLVEPLELIVAREHPLSTAGQIALREVAEQSFIMLRRAFALRTTAEQLCRQAGFEPVVAFESEDLPTVEGLVGAGLGVAIVPSTHGWGDGQPNSPVRRLAITDDGATRQVGISWPAERRLLPAAESFRRHVVAEMLGDH
jgi:DNA-binding transcriptional LysR family regulator